MKYYKEFNCVIVDYPSTLEFTYSLDYKSFSQKTFTRFKDEAFKYKLFEDGKYIFSSENIYRSAGPMGELTLDSYLLRYDKTNSKNEIMQMKHVRGIANLFTFAYVLACS